MKPEGFGSWASRGLEAEMLELLDSGCAASSGFSVGCSALEPWGMWVQRFVLGLEVRSPATPRFGLQG